MAKNDFKAFATDRNANVISQEEWEALPALLSGLALLQIVGGDKLIIPFC